MAITEESRHRMYERLEEVLGRDQAATLMEHLPPVGWADVATRRDVDNVANVLRVEFAREQRNLVFAMVAANSTLAALAFAAARLT